jgi:hypothetical protein
MQVSRYVCVKGLRFLGAEVAEAEFDVEASLVAALDSAHDVFAITNF